jgi:hypothetical protein
MPSKSAKMSQKRIGAALGVRAFSATAHCLMIQQHMAQSPSIFVLWTGLAGSKKAIYHL